jgi:hypothetical protein
VTSSRVATKVGNRGAEVGAAFRVDRKLYKKLMYTHIVNIFIL